jgi:hypothetical protein
MHSFDEHIGGYYGQFAEMIYHGRIISHTQNGGGIMDLDVPGEMLDEAEFSQVGYFNTFFAHDNIF